ncbi:fibroblast growth factor-binding protein 1 [Cololabis saira]|uniref:fibroblast growth factor-binding protein 1 n=1 Tax=Cololabis saira TaxID=129043 RepID=UPI002AD329E9|nr:fibroblast growth factor-binding protein 1 [Cololabis saira]
MLLLKGLSSWLLVVFLQQQVSLVSGRAQRSGSRSGRRSAASGRGKFPSGSMQCAWSAQEVGDAVTLRVTCEDAEARVKGGITDLACNYVGKPQSCPGYRSDPKGFWKQAGRALKKLQGRVCRDERALVKAGMCKQAPKDAHFKLDVSTSVIGAQSGVLEPRPELQRPTASNPPARPASSRPTACSKPADHRRTAGEYCSSSWASVCTFFLSMLQSDDC